MKNYLSMCKPFICYLLNFIVMLAGLMPIKQCFSQGSMPLLCGGNHTIDSAALNRAIQYELSNAENLPSFSGINIRVYFHILRDNNGINAGANETQVEAEFNQLTADFAAYSICFVKMGLNYINNTTLNNLNVTNSADVSLLQTFNIPKCINIYYHKSLSGTSGSIGGNAYSLPSLFCSISSSNLAQGQTTSHEIGHCFGLLHTHAFSNGYEAINGFNSTIWGDGISDTPADPYAYKSSGNSCFTSSNCLYTGNCQDPFFQTNFNTPYTNLMSYWWNEGITCYTNLITTTGQQSRVQSFLNSDPALISCQSTADTIIGPAVNISSGYFISSVLNNVVTNGSVNFSGTSFVAVRGGFVLLNPGFIANATGGGKMVFSITSCSFLPRQLVQTTMAENILNIPGELVLYPNPFSNQTNIAYFLAEDGIVDIIILNPEMQVIKTLVSKSSQVNGKHLVQFDATNMTNGIYFCKMVRGNKIDVIKMIVQK